MSVVETKTCRHCSSSFDIMQEDIDFYAKISPRFPQSPRPAPITEDNDARGDLVPDTPLVQGGQGGADATTRGDYVAQIPTPTLCPDCRQCRRLAFRNERKLYRRKCDASQKDIISIYSPDKPYKVYDQKIRRSDARDPMDYGRDFDFSRTFMEQFGELMMEVPHCSILNIGSENSDYTNLAAYNKNSYLLVESSNNDSSLYGYWLQKSDHCVDCAMVNHSENCYQSLDIDDSYKLFFSQYCRSCSDSYLIENCTNCQFCFGCI
ncbi:MAG: hypothetical protein H6766_03440 [Candidatus Peribacteria bacterium]|nr:MAG: hypothetical protein H6766_03440 [Candidatus Peribacteria bacterium]